MLQQKQAILFLSYVGAAHKATFSVKIVLQQFRHGKSGAQGVTKDFTPFHAIDADLFSSYYHTS